MSQMSANLTPCNPKAASIKGKLHVPRARPNEHPAMHQIGFDLNLRPHIELFGKLTSSGSVLLSL